jgi:FAD/FMN-containing dehydrogenase
MATVSLVQGNGKGKVALDAVFQSFRSGLQGEVLLPDSGGYDAARALWNGMIDRRPGAIARCASGGDVVRCVNLARDHGLLVSVRGGGHNIAGKASCDGGLMIDLSGLTSVHVDPSRRTARVGAGATLGDFDAAAQAHGLATPLGINSTTGVGGLTLGGGFGWLTRKLGLTIDNLLSAEVVTADGTVRTASATHEPGLFWGLRGGGGNFGVVTSFEFRLHPVGPELLSGPIIHPFDDAPAVLRRWRDLAAEAPDERSCWVVLRKAPPLPFLPPAWHGREVAILAAVYAGDPVAGEKGLLPVRRIGTPIVDGVAPHPYVAFQKAFDPLLAPGARNYWKSHNFKSLPDAFFDTLLGFVARLPSDQTEVFLGHLGGAANRVAAASTAYPHRDTEFIMNIHGRWETAAEDARCVGWARELYDAVAPFANGGVYSNFVSDGDENAKAAYGPNYDRLAQLKREFDPHNLFRLNQNVAPA